MNINTFLEYTGMHIKRCEHDIETFKTQIQESNDMCHILKWKCEGVMYAQEFLSLSSKFYSALMEHINNDEDIPKEKLDCLEVHIDSLKEDIFKHHIFRHNSSCAVSNIHNIERAKAICKVIDLYDKYMRG